MGLNRAYLQSGRTSESDECLTPRYGVLPMVKYLKACGFKKIWCPFDDSNSFYVRVLRSHGFIVHNTSLFNGYDFLTYQPRFFDFDVIVSNPPFSIKDEVLQRCYSFGKPFAVLLPQNSLQGVTRVDMFLKYGMEYLGFDKRICFYTNGNYASWSAGNHFASGYFCHNILPDKMIFEKLLPVSYTHLTLPTICSV